MKCFVITIAMLFSFTTLAARDQRELLKCLGKEEKKFHVNKDTGPLYELNQRLISEMIQIPGADLTREHYQEICVQSFSPSWKLLELSIREGKSLFKIPRTTSKIQTQITRGMIEDYLEASREIFLRFMSSIQMLSPTPTCLKEEIPLLDSFFTDIKYLEEDIEMVRIFRKRDVKIFEKLKDYPQAFERCRARIKKKPKSGSVEASKNS